jgi:hypothetical protein
LQCDAQLSRFFPIHDNLAIDLRIEAFNALNHPDFNLPTATTNGVLGGTSGGAAARSSATFGEISLTSNLARVFQGGVKFIF